MCAADKRMSCVAGPDSGRQAVRSTPLYAIEFRWEACQLYATSAERDALGACPCANINTYSFILHV